MAGFNFERDLAHQNNAIDAILNVLNGFEIKNDSVPAIEKVSNPCLIFEEFNYALRIFETQKLQKINKGQTPIINKSSRVLDISMETGTGKTYTYAKTLFELNKSQGISKFIVVVPTLSIKAGTVSFLKSKATQEHFKQDYQRSLKVHVVESQKKGKGKKSYMPQAIVDFVEAIKNESTLHILVINAGMINSPTMTKSFDRQIFDSFDSPFAALTTVKPFTIIDEPHKFPPQKTTWDNIQKIGSQFILRFGATFNNHYENLIHELTAVDAFNQDLVKGVVTYVEEFEGGDAMAIKLKNIDSHEVVFELTNNGYSEQFTLTQGDSLVKIHSAMAGVTIENHNKTIVLLSNGLELKKGEAINPYSYSESLQDKMIATAVKKHFEIERGFLTRTVKIKPLTLFFIDDIEGYRSHHQITGTLKTKFEALVKAQAEALLKTETHPFYRTYLEKTLKDLSLVHGGYFSKDNTDKDDKIEQEITEILHDKESLLSLDNPRRFIFSKWTLREGWDNPNVFQICKLRSSGSQTSKLQEVGRGLRLPVNEYMSRVKNEKFELHYYVDFTEKEFAESLINEINSQSGFADATIETTLTEALISKIMQAYPELSRNTILESLDEAGAINRANEFKDGGFDLLKTFYPDIFGLKSGKVRSGNNPATKATLRAGKYNEFKALWETINQRVILEYKINNEAEFKNILKAYFIDNKETFKPQGSITRRAKIEFIGNTAFARVDEGLNNNILPLVTMSYSAFSLALARALSINLNTLHQVFIDIKNDLDINLYLSQPTIRVIQSGFNKYLLDNAFSKYEITFNKVSNKIHPTVFTDTEGEPLKAITTSGLGTQKDSNIIPSDRYLFEEVFYDSDLERENIVTTIIEVIVFTKIPKNSIRIPVAGGGTYSPDFAYVVKYADGKKALSLIVETKDKEKRALFMDEQQKIKHAETLFNSFDHDFKVSFETQFKTMAIKDIINKIATKDLA